ncbi:hypothetical protein [Microbacterium sp. KR10-403]|uniref:hypothetical protein n=1 Tax=Microbacterium sp. KR10-403 TaxID=3158581 RepID=UPI0032E5298D
MTPELTTELLPPASRNSRAPRWAVRFEGKLIGEVQAKKIGRSSSQFYEGLVLIQGRLISIELDTDLEERCEEILKAWRDPSSNVHTRYALKLKE